jgi:DNA-binding transcriptional ArsR family regulator
MTYAPNVSVSIPYDKEKLTRVASLLHAVADPQRLFILAMLAEKELCVTDLSSITSDDLPTISQRLKLLYEAGLVKRRRQGKHIFYSAVKKYYLTEAVFTLLDTPPNSQTPSDSE